MDTLLFIGIGVFLFLGFEKAAVVNSLVFQATGVDFDLSNPLVPAVNLSVLVQNPTSGSLTLYSLAGYFSFNGTPGGNVSFFPGAPMIVGPNSQTPITLRLSISDIQLASDIINYVKGGGGQISIAISATANVNNAPLPVSLVFNP